MKHQAIFDNTITNHKTTLQSELSLPRCTLAVIMIFAMTVYTEYNQFQVHFEKNLLMWSVKLDRLYFEVCSTKGHHSMKKKPLLLPYYWSKIFPFQMYPHQETSQIDVTHCEVELKQFFIKIYLNIKSIFFISFIFYKF